MRKVVLLTFFLASFLKVFSQLDNKFDYLKQGDDWDNLNCTDIQTSMVLNLSPLNLEEGKAGDFNVPFYFFPKYLPTEAKVTPRNITVEINATEEFGKTYTITAGKQVGIYQAIGMRIHSEAEHTIDGKRYPIELQIHHQLIKTIQNPSKYQANLFVSVFFDDSEDKTNNDLLGNITKALLDKSETTHIDLSYLLDLSATRKKLYSYAGTQTMPPCYPTSWFVFPEPFHASPEQIKVIYDLYHNNEKFEGKGNYRAIKQNKPDQKNNGYFGLNMKPIQMVSFEDL